MAAHRTAFGRIMKFGTQIEDSLNINHSKFGVSNSNSLATTCQIGVSNSLAPPLSKFGVSNSLAPPLVQIFTHVYANIFDP